MARGAADDFVTDFGFMLSIFFRDPDAGPSVPKPSRSSGSPEGRNVPRCGGGCILAVCLRGGAHLRVRQSSACLVRRVIHQWPLRARWPWRATRSWLPIGKLEKNMFRS